MPDKSTVFRWLRTHKDFCDQYTRAKEESADALADEILDIADNAENDWMEMKFGKDWKKVINREHVERSKLRIESRKWLLAKTKPKKYGEKLDLSTNGKDLPMPILGYVQSNNRNKENNGDAKAHPSDPGGNVGKQDGIDSPLPDTPSANGQDANHDLDRVGVIPPSETRSDEGLSGDSPTAPILS